MNNTAKTITGILLILGACFWAFGKYKETRLGSVANNGNNGDTPELSEQSRERMRAAWENRPPRTEQGPPSEEERTRMREEFEKVLTPEDRRVMEKAQAERERSRATVKAALSPEEQKILEGKMRGRRGRGGGPGRGGDGMRGGGRGGASRGDGAASASQAGAR